MKENKFCKIVQDLLPNYMEKMTSEETNKFIEEHIKSCEECTKKIKDMKSDVILEKVDDKEINYLKKIKEKTKNIIFIISLILIVISLITIITILKRAESREKQIKEMYAYYDDYMNNLEQQRFNCYIESQEFDFAIFYDKEFKINGTLLNLKKSDNKNDLKHYNNLLDIISQRKDDSTQLIQAVIEYCKDNNGQCERVK